MVAIAPWFPPLRCSTPEPSTRLHAGGYNFLTSHPCISLEPRFNREVGSTREKLRSSNKGYPATRDHHTKDGFGQASILPPCPAALLVTGVDFSRPRRMDRSAGVALGLSEHGFGPSCRTASIVGLSGRPRVRTIGRDSEEPTTALEAPLTLVLAATVALPVVRWGDVSRCATERPDRLRQLLASAGERSPINRPRYREDHVPLLALRWTVRDHRIDPIYARQINPRQAPLQGQGVLRPPIRRNARGSECRPA